MAVYVYQHEEWHIESQDYNVALVNLPAIPRNPNLMSQIISSLPHTICRYSVNPDDITDWFMSGEERTVVFEEKLRKDDLSPTLQKIPFVRYNITPALYHRRLPLIWKVNRQALQLADNDYSNSYTPYLGDIDKHMFASLSTIVMDTPLSSEAGIIVSESGMKRLTSFEFLHNTISTKSMYPKGTTLPRGACNIIDDNKIFKARSNVLIKGNQAYNYFAIKHLHVGDKLATRHDHKGVVSAILPDNEMPRLQNNSYADIVFGLSSLYSRGLFGFLFDLMYSMIRYTNTQELQKWSQGVIKPLQLYHILSSKSTSKQQVRFQDQTYDAYVGFMPILRLPQDSEKQHAITNIHGPEDTFSINHNAIFVAQTLEQYYGLDTKVSKYLASIYGG